MCKHCEWEDYLARAEDLVSRGSNTMDGIADWIEQEQHVTEKMQRAIERVEEAFDRREDMQR